MIEYKEEKKRMFFMGTELVSFYVKYPQIEEKDQINFVFDALASNTVSWVSEELFGLAQTEYKNGSWGRGHSSQRPYRYTLQILADEIGAEYCINLTSILCRGRNEEIKRYEEKFAVDADSGLIKKKKKTKNGA